MKKYTIIIVMFIMASCKKEIIQNEAPLTESAAIRYTDFTPQFFHMQQSVVNPCNGETLTLDGWVSASYSGTSIFGRHSVDMWKYRASFTATGSTGAVYLVKLLEHENGSFSFSGNEEVIVISKVLFIGAHSSFVQTYKNHFILEEGVVRVFFTDFEARWNCAM